MKRLKDLSAVLALLSVFAFFGSLTFVVWEGWNARNEVGKAVAVRVDPVLKSVTTASDAVSKTATEVPKQMTDMSNKADAQLTALRGTVDATVATANAQMTAVQETVLKLGDKVDPLVASYTKLGDESTAAVKIVKGALPPFADCAYYDDAGDIVGGNPDCLFNRVQGVSKAVEQMAQEGAKAAPILSKQAERVGAGMAGLADAGKREADELTKPMTTKQKIESWLSIIPRVVKILL